MCHKFTFSSASSLLLMEIHLVDRLCLFKLQLSFGLFWHGEMLKTLLSWATHRTVEMFLISSSTYECICFVWAHGNPNFYWFFRPLIVDCSCVVMVGIFFLPWQSPEGPIKEIPKQDESLCPVSRSSLLTLNILLVCGSEKCKGFQICQ